MFAAYSEKSKCVGIARLGNEDQLIAAGSMTDLLDVDFGAPLHCLVIVGETHPVEEEMLEFYKVKWIRNPQLWSHQCNDCHIQVGPNYTVLVCESQIQLIIFLMFMNISRYSMPILEYVRNRPMVYKWVFLVPTWILYLHNNQVGNATWQSISYYMINLYIWTPTGNFLLNSLL